MGEPLENFEIEFMLKLAQDDGDDPNKINIEKLAKILVPSDNILDDLAREADEKLKREEAAAKAKETSEEAMGSVTGGMGGFPGLM